MLPKPPPRLGQIGFLYLPPIRVQGVSVAGEATAVMVPEYDICFDMGMCPRPMLAARIVAITHGHMDHVAALPYYFSQRWFQGMGVGTCICDPRIADAVRTMMAGWIELEQQKTPHEILPLGPEDEYELKNNVFLRPFRLDHTVPCQGYAIVERRTKLRDEFVDLPQHRLMELKREGTEITRERRVPILAYLGDTGPGPCLDREEIRTARVVVTECTFFEEGHRDRAAVGKHLHVADLAEFVRGCEAEAIVVTHVSRRTNLRTAREALRRHLGPNDADRVHLLMDHRSGRARYEAQVAEVRDETEDE